MSLRKIAEATSTNSRHSLQVYSYHSNEESFSVMRTYIQLSLDVECTPASKTTMQFADIMTYINLRKPEFIAFSTDLSLFEKFKKNLEPLEPFLANLKGLVIIVTGDNTCEGGILVSTQVQRFTFEGIPLKPHQITLMSWQHEPFPVHAKTIQTLINKVEQPIANNNQSSALEQNLEPTSSKKIVKIKNTIPKDAQTQQATTPAKSSTTDAVEKTREKKTEDQHVPTHPPLGKNQEFSWRDEPSKRHQEEMNSLLFRQVKHEPPPRTQSPTEDQYKVTPNPSPITEGLVCDPAKGYLRYRASLVHGHVHEVFYCYPPGWKPDKEDLDHISRKHAKEPRAVLEFWADSPDGLPKTIDVKMSSFSNMLGLPLLSHKMFKDLDSV